MGATLDSLPKLANNFVETRTESRETKDYMNYKNASKELKKNFLHKISSLYEKSLNLDLYTMFDKKVQKKINEWAKKAEKKGELKIQKDGAAIILDTSLLEKFQRYFAIIEKEPKYLALKDAKSKFKTALKDLKEQKIPLDEIKKYLNENRVLDEKTKEEIKSLLKKGKTLEDNDSSNIKFLLNNSETLHYLSRQSKYLENFNDAIKKAAYFYEKKFN